MGKVKGLESLHKLAEQGEHKRRMMGREMKTALRVLNAVVQDLDDSPTARQLGLIESALTSMAKVVHEFRRQNGMLRRVERKVTKTP